ncbi:MAG: peptide chain release factor N(5)-glutamine methyltransferase [Actinomycetota bacterium]
MTGARPSLALARAERYLERHGVASARVSAEALLADVLGTDRAGLYTRAEPLTPAETRAYGRSLCARCSGTPLQHVTGEQAFRRLRLAVRPGVFVPRPETEVLVDLALGELADVAVPVVVDVGTGSGAIALAIADERPDARVLATDRSSEAVALARENAARLGLAVEVLEGDLLAPLPADLVGRVDLVACNPPYVRREEVAALPADVLADPATALVGDAALLARIADAARAVLRPGGVLVLEIGEAQGEETRALLAERFRSVRIERDLVGRDRFAVAS